MCRLTRNYRLVEVRKEETLWTTYVIEKKGWFFWHHYLEFLDLGDAQERLALLRKQFQTTTKRVIA